MMLKLYGIFSIYSGHHKIYSSNSLFRLLGVAFSDAKLPLAAVECFRIACHIKPDSEELKGLLGKLLKESVNQDEQSVASMVKGGLVI
jgi:hypothetical protein